MHKLNKLNSILQCFFYLLGFYILIRMLVPIIKPISIAAELSYNQNNFFQQIINKSNNVVEYTMNQYEDEDKKELFSMVFKYITNIDIENPKTYIASQIPVLGMIDISSLIAKEDGPVVVIPNEKIEKDKDDKKISDNPGSSDGVVVKPGEIVTPPKIKLDPSKPMILILHTHTTESYNAAGVKNGNFSSNVNVNVCKVGEELKKELEEKYGIATIHDMTVHDIPVRDHGYSKSRITIDKYVKKYPGVKLIIDLHRDSANAKISTAIINGERYARVMFVIGPKNKNYVKSEATAKSINGILNSYYPGFSRGFYYLKGAKLNQDLSSKLVLIEVGSNGNSIEEAIRTSKILARVISISIK